MSPSQRKLEKRLQLQSTTAKSRACSNRIDEIQFNSQVPNFCPLLLLCTNLNIHHSMQGPSNQHPSQKFLQIETRSTNHLHKSPKTTFFISLYFCHGIAKMKPLVRGKNKNAPCVIDRSQRCKTPETTPTSIEHTNAEMNPTSQCSNKNLKLLTQPIIHYASRFN